MICLNLQDSITTPKVQEKLHENEARVKVLTEEWAGKWNEAAKILKVRPSYLDRLSWSPSFVDLVKYGRQCIHIELLNKMLILYCVASKMNSFEKLKPKYEIDMYNRRKS